MKLIAQGKINWKFLLIVIVSSVIVLGEFFVWKTYSPPESLVKRDIAYCEKDDTCKLWWGPDYCGCGNKYYKFPENRMRPSLACGGNADYKCKCIENKCQ